VRRYPVAVFVVVFALLFVGVDRIAAAVADRVIASKLRTALASNGRPDVAVRGFPLLTQVVAQRYDEVDVTVHDLHRGQLVASRLAVALHGVHVGTGALLTRRVRRIPVDRATGTVLFRYRDLNEMLRNRQVSVSYGGGHLVRVSGIVDTGAEPLRATGTATARVDGNQLVVTAQSVDIGAGSFVNGALSTLARGRLSFRLLLTDLPFAIRVGSVDVRRDGVVATGRSDGFVVDVTH
jgi:hypothetical protein